MDEMTDVWTRRRLEPSSAIMIVVTAVALLSAAWVHYRSRPAIETLTVGARVPPLEVLDLDTSEPLVLLGHSGKLVWLTFWSADSATASSDLKLLDQATRPLTAHRRFVQMTAAVEAGKAGQIRSMLRSSKLKLPVYLAGAATLQRFGTSKADPPLHVLIGPDCRIIAIARGGDGATIARLASMAQQQLEELDPAGTTRFAAACPGFPRRCVIEELLGWPGHRAKLLTDPNQTITPEDSSSACSHGV
jgi:hypothetical protein